MERLAEQLAKFTVIGLDTSVFIYHLEGHPDYLDLTQELLGGVEHGRWEAITSVITLMEINVRPLQLNLPNIARKYEVLLVNFPHLRIVDLDREVVRKAARLRADYLVRTADALRVAACLVHDSQVFLTNDRRLDRLAPVIEVLILDDFRG